MGETRLALEFEWLGMETESTYKLGLSRSATWLVEWLKETWEGHRCPGALVGVRLWVPDGDAKKTSRVAMRGYTDNQSNESLLGLLGRQCSLPR